MLKCVEIADVTETNRLDGRQLIIYRLLVDAENPPSGGETPNGRSEIAVGLRTSCSSAEGYVKRRPSEVRASIYCEVWSRPVRA